MKHYLIMAAAGIGLFVATVIGLLGMQGRLNHEGTRGIPLLGALFPAPAEPTPPDRATDAGGPAAGSRGEGLGKEERTPYRLGESLFDGSKDAGEPKHGEPPAAHDGAPATQDPPTATSRPTDPQDPQWEHKVEDLMSEGAYERGRYFKFPRLEAGISVQAINDILKDARDQRARIEEERAVLARRKAELDARELDIKDRQEDVQRRIQELEQLRGRIEQEIKDAHGTVLLIKQTEMARWREHAKSVAALGSRKAADILLEWWKTEEGQEKVLKTLAAMPEDSRDQVLAALSVPQVRELLDRRLQVIVEPAKKDGR
jgi:DNA-binding transcriptional MerR regulator